ncbi:hypothetical protein D3C76_1549220 [compost metagenome]
MVLDQGGLLVALAQQQALCKGRLCQLLLVTAHIEGQRLEQLPFGDMPLILAGRDDQAGLTLTQQPQLGVQFAVGKH